ncbi:MULTISPECIES: tyrosine-type recombinase/integrase [unclassified Caballeronia]|uniref:tyrosine-type recombinase/integrase n=1 Tax=unclassified Caballeronia TaxID=2646786 RepID=UPI00286130C5|nr:MULTISPECIES: tyrosine-type recombinase/integrase [unclassified Caballeronia]MDR5777355.1 tyrosine-type recombinase/integrase [Caballeronia sp. LZ002]MDR5852793.1 tyrosine-type recombinase/integrase [Caballeronia sp. LZ003]
MSYRLFRIGKIWHYRFQLNGARVQRSTRESVKHKAEAVAARAYNDVKLWSRGCEPVPTLRDLFVKWIAANEPVVSNAHIKSMRTVARLHLYELGDVSVDQLTNGAIEQARIEHLKTHSRASANHWLKSIKVVCNWAVRRNILPMVPWSVKLIKLQKRPRTTLPASMASKWLIEVDAAAARQPGVSIAVRLMLGLGLREMETITARWEWLDWERGTYTPGRTKGREADPVPVPQWLLDYLHPMRHACGLIVTRKSGEAFKAGFTRRAMFAANAACEVVGLTPHRLRGTFATLLSEQGVPIQTIRRVMRHKDARTTMVYLEADLGSVVDAQARLSERMGLVDLAKRKVSGEKVAKSIAQTLVVTEFANSCESSAQGAKSGTKVIMKPSTS